MEDIRGLERRLSESCASEPSGGLGGVGNDTCRKKEYLNWVY